MKHTIRCSFCNKLFEMDEATYKQIENHVLNMYFDNLRILKEQVEKERQYLEQLKQSIIDSDTD